MNNRDYKENKPDRKQLRFGLHDFCTITHKIFNYANSGVFRDEFMREVCKILLKFSNCDGIEFWVKEHNKYYQSKVENPEKSFRFNTLQIPQEEPNIKAATQNNLGIEFLCHSIISGHLSPETPFSTKNGSFWIGDTRKPVEFVFGSERTPHVNNFRDKRYKSLALIPIKFSNKTIGLLNLKSRKLNYFHEAEIKFYESIAQIIGDALVTRQAQISLRERVKELSCLYGIALLVEKPDVALDSILQGIVNLLPSAMLYPEIATARIVLDGNSYSTANFEKCQDKLTADIIIDSINRGKIEVGYIEKKVELDEGPFLKEERNLINTVASEIALIVERKKAAEDRERLQNQLRHADRLATIGQLAAGVAHELNEPLGNILGFAQLIKKSTGFSNQNEKDIDNIIKAALHAREVIKKLMFFARKMPPKKVQVNLNQLVEDGLYFLKVRCNKEGIKIVRHLSPDLPEITADPSQLYQVFVNLVVNAIQAMPQGGTLTLRTFVSNKHISLVVEDTGIGMSEEVMKQIFVPFFTTKGVGEGTGLGLSVAHGIVTAHGGIIEVTSKVGEGSRFEVKLPLTGAPDVMESE